MAFIKTKTISWNASTSGDVVGYNVRYKVDNGTPFSYSDSYIQTSTPSVVAPDDFPSGTFSEDTDYLIGVSAVDDMGNESDIVEIISPFDFSPPLPPTGLTVS